MNKAELIQAFASHTEFTNKDTSKFLDGFCEVVSRELSAGNQVALIGFGTFKVLDQAERPGRNVRTGEVITILARRVARFLVGKLLKARVAMEAKAEKSKKAGKSTLKKIMS